MRRRGVLLIVGRQVKNEKNGRSDLTAVDNNGNVVLVEIKRDRRDIEHRKEAFEFQAIRYAAGYATIEKTDELVKKVYAPYIEKYRSEKPYFILVLIGERNILNMNKTTFIHTKDLMGTSQYLFLWKIGKGGEVIGIDWQTYIY